MKLAQAWWTGHATRMPVERQPNKVLYYQLKEGKRSQDDQTNPRQTHPLSFTNDFNIPAESWEHSTQDRTKQRCHIRKGADQYEAKRIHEAERKREEHKTRA